MDNNQYLEIFLEESEEHIENLNDNLLKLEKDKSDKHLIDEIFRSAHTLKGMAATMGYEKINKLTHKMEDVFDKIRRNALEIDDNVIDILFKCNDALSEMLSNVSNNGNDNFDIDELLKLLDSKCQLNDEETAATSIKKSIDKKSCKDINVYERDIIEKAIKNGYKAYNIHISLDNKCIMKSARAFTIFNLLEKLGDIIDSTPSAEDIEDEKFDYDFYVNIISLTDKKLIEEKINTLSEIKNIDINEIITNMKTDEIKTNNANTQKLTNNKKLNNLSKLNKSVRVDIGRLDNLMNLVSELIIIKTRLEGIQSTEKNPDTISTIEYLERITTNLHDAVMKVRMVPVERVFNRFPRMVRDLSRELNKKISLNMYGKDTEVDRTVIDEIGDPLVHLIRNSIDHGIEEPNIRISKGKNEIGNIDLKAYHEGNNVIIEVSDDGDGIDFEKVKSKAIANGLLSKEDLSQITKEKLINILFEAGFSTSETVTDISGRGVGLDVVKNKVESLNGSISVKSEKNVGTKFIIKLPLTLAIIQALLIKIDNENYAFPLNSISEIINEKSENIHEVQGKEVIQYRGKVIPLIRINRLFDISEAKTKSDLLCVVIKKGDNLAACIVDELIGQQEIVIKPLGKYLRNVKVIAGATILGDGQVALIIDSNNLF